MNLKEMIYRLKDQIDSVFHADWVGTILIAILIVVITAVVAHLVTHVLKRVLKSNVGPIPSASIFINIGRVVVWVLGISAMLSICFNVDVGAAITALGIGGIAISLGFQDTLSNLIGGLQIIITGLIEPGDRVKVGDYEGAVCDVTWRHTTIETARGERVVIPNSVINSEALVKLAPETDVRIDITVTPSPTLTLAEQITQMENEVNEAVEKIAVLEKKAKIKATGTTERGYKALLSFEVGSGVKKHEVVDAAMKAISSCAVKSKSTHVKKLEHNKIKRDIQDKILDDIKS